MVMNATHRMISASCLLATGVLALSAHAASTDTAAAPWQVEWDARVRHEQVDNDAFSRDARADTLRLRLGLRASFGDGWSALLEGAGVASAGNDYNSGANGRTRYPGITDPRGSELNQAWLAWQGDTFGVTAGRRRLLLDNQRWVGNSGWRQHEQTFDGVGLQWQPASGWTLRYDWLDRVHRVAGRDALNPLARERRLDTHLLNAGYARGNQQWTGYAYLHDDRDVSTASTVTWGLRWTGKPAATTGGFGWALEAAQQRDYASNPQSFAHTYWLAEPAWTQHGITARLGWEHLGGNGRHALQTPLATLHAFNGWADQFNVTPVGGLDDRYVAFNGNLGRHGVAAQLGWVVGWHDYRAVHRPDGDSHYGSEWNASLSAPLTDGLSALVKVSDYRSDGFGRDDARLWLQLEWHGTQPLLR
jgi:hypothetical protein